MKTLDAIYKEYQKERTCDIEEKLCSRIERLAKILLHQFRVYKNDPYFEEYVQTAYLLFFELLETFDPEKGKLEGYFMVSFKFTLISLVRERAISRKEHRRLLSEDLLDESTPYNITLVSSLVDKLWYELNDSERIVLGYMLVGEKDPTTIAKYEDTTFEQVDWAMDKLRRKAEKLFFEDGEHIL
jgi:hypothetical protein